MVKAALAIRALPAILVTLVLVVVVVVVVALVSKAPALSAAPAGLFLGVYKQAAVVVRAVLAAPVVLAVRVLIALVITTNPALAVTQAQAETPVVRVTLARLLQAFQRLSPAGRRETPVMQGRAEAVVLAVLEARILRAPL